MNPSTIRTYPFTFLMSLCMAIIVMHHTIGSITHLSSISTFVAMLSIGFVLIIREVCNVNKLFLAYIGYLGFTLLILDPPSIFSPWMRFMLFIGVLIIASPLFQNTFLQLFRRYCLYSILAICIIVSIISFIFFFMGINFMDYTANLDFAEKGGLFGGLANHSIILGIVSGISICTLLYLGITKKWLWLTLLIPCIGSLLFSASRGAIGASIAGVIAILIAYGRHSNSRTKIWLLLLIAIPSLAYIANNTSVMDGIISKSTDRSSSLIESREDKINYRIEEFKESPIIGIGFSTISTVGGDEIDKRSGRIEPGSSWFSLLSMTGIIGLIFFICIIYRCLKLQISNNSTHSILLIGLIGFFIVSLFSEGYIFAAGSPLCFTLWLLIGNCYD